MTNPPQPTGPAPAVTNNQTNLNVVVNVNGTPATASVQADMEKGVRKALHRIALRQTGDTLQFGIR